MEGSHSISTPGIGSSYQYLILQEVDQLFQPLTALGILVIALELVPGWSRFFCLEVKW